MHEDKVREHSEDRQLDEQRGGDRWWPLVAKPPAPLRLEREADTSALRLHPQEVSYQHPADLEDGRRGPPSQVHRTLRKGPRAQRGAQALPHGRKQRREKATCSGRAAAPPELVHRPSWKLRRARKRAVHRPPQRRVGPARGSRRNPVQVLVSQVPEDLGEGGKEGAVHEVQGHRPRRLRGIRKAERDPLVRGG